MQPVLGLLAVQIGLAQVGQHQVDVGAAGQHGNARARAQQLVGQRPGAIQRPLLAFAKRGDCAIRNATALPAMMCSSGPPC